MKSTIYCLFAAGWMLCLQSATHAQTLPSEMQISPDGHRLVAGSRDAAGLYDQSVIRSFHLNFSQPDYWLLLTNNYATRTDIPATLTVDGVTYDSVGVHFKGQTSYSGVRNSDKKSFNIKLNAWKKDQNLMGYETLNLNNCFQDASYMREYLYLSQIRKHIPAAKVAYVNLSINGQSWGLYPHVQQLNNEFVKEWFFSNDGSLWRADVPLGGMMTPGWGDGTAALNYLGADTTLYQRYYTLKRTERVNPWEDLVRTCRALNQLPLNQLEDSIGEYLDLDRTLWFLASEILFTDDDSYVFKGKMDYYLYWNPESRQMIPLEFDGNTAMSTNAATTWSPFYNSQKVNYPLLNRLLAVPAIRQRYLAHFRTLLQERFNPAEMTTKIDDLAARIDSLVQADPKKLYNYNSHLMQRQSLKNFFTNRYNYLIANTEISQPAPAISDAQHSALGIAWQAPRKGEAASVRATVTSVPGISAVWLYHSAQLAGEFVKAPMYDDGLHDDGTAGDGVYGAEIPGYPAGTFVRYYIEAVAANPAQACSFEPAGAEHDVFFYMVQAGQAGAATVVINELMADNSTSVMDPAGQYDDWIELYNTTGQAIDLSGYFLSDKDDNLTKWTFPAGTSIDPYGYLIVWADENGTQGPLHTNFKLSAAGEIVMLLNADTVLLDRVDFGPQQTDKSYAREPNGTGSFVIKKPTFNANNDLTLTVDPIAEARRLQAFPNPARSAFTFVSPLRPSDGRLRIFDSAGRIVWDAPWQAQASVQVQQWPAGMYLLKAGAQTLRLQVMH